MSEKISKSSSGQNLASSMGSVSSTLSSSDSSLSSVILFGKWLQLLSKVSNFVQVLPLIYLLSNSLPSSVKQGSLLGVSFIFTGMSSPNAVDFQATQSSVTQRNLLTIEFNNSEQDNHLPPRLLSTSSQSSSELVRLLQILGLSSNIFSNYIFIHLSVIVSAKFIAFCMIFRRLLEGKQYTVVVINIISNIMASSLQSALIIILFSWAFSFAVRENLALTVFYLIVYTYIYIELIYITCSKSSEYIQDNIPNYFQDINSKAKGAKSYLSVSFFKKHLIVSLNLIMVSSPFPCAIIIACIFFLNAVYILSFRFFIYFTFNFVKALQEFLLCSLYCLLAKTIQDQQTVLNQTVIADDELMVTVYEGAQILYLMMVCIGFSFCIFFFRLIISAKQTYQMITLKKKERTFNIFLDPIIFEGPQTIETSTVTTKNFKSKLDDESKQSTQQFNLELQSKQYSAF